MSNQEDTFKRNFNAREYLHFYWPEEKLDVEDMFIMTFLHKTCSHYRNFLKGKSWLELSGGPVMDKYISASKYVKEIYHSAYTSSSIHEIQNFIDNNNRQYNWSKRFEFILKLEEEEEEMNLEQSSLDDTNLNSGKNEKYKILEMRLREKLNKNVLFCDVKNDNKCGINYNNNTEEEKDTIDLLMKEDKKNLLVDILSIHSVVECISKTPEECFKLLTNALQLLKKGGLLIMTINIETNHWNNSNTLLYQAANIKTKEILDYLSAYGFYDIKYEIFTRDDNDEITNMEKTLALSCRLKEEP